MARRYLGMQWAEWQALDARIAELEEDIKAQVKQDESARRLTGIKGVGPLIASAAACLLQAGHYAANLGLVPREHSSGGRQRLGGITKRGNRYLRRLLVQGAWSVLRYAHRSEDRLSRWARQVTCLLQAGDPHHLVNAVSRRRVPAGLRHAHRPV